MLDAQALVVGGDCARRDRLDAGHVLLHERQQRGQVLHFVAARLLIVEVLRRPAKSSAIRKQGQVATHCDSLHTNFS